MPHINPNVLFQGGFSKPTRIESSEMDKYLKSFTALTTQVREEIAETKGVLLDGVSADHVILSTTVEVGSNSKLVMENCGNMLAILDSTKEHSGEIDERTLAKLNALLDAAVEKRLEVVYKEAEHTPDQGQRQELMILSHWGSGQPPQTTGIQAVFASEDITSVQEFSDTYQGKLQQLEKFWVNPTTQDVETPKDDKITTVKLDGLKDAKKGSSDDEGQDDILDGKRDRDEQGRVEDEADRRRLEDERKKDREDVIEDRNKAFSDSKQTRKLDQASKRAHGEKTVEPTTD